MVCNPDVGPLLYDFKNIIIVIIFVYVQMPSMYRRKQRNRNEERMFLTAPTQHKGWAM